MIIWLCCAVLATAEDFTQHEYHLNGLEYALWNTHKIQDCFVEMGDRQIVADFVSSCQSAATCDLWTRIAKLCSALQSALLQINEKSGMIIHPGSCLWH